MLPADAAVLAMGPWTSEASAWLNGAVELGITGHKYHSVVLRPTEEGVASAHCLFTSFKHTSGKEERGQCRGTSATLALTIALVPVWFWGTFGERAT